MRGWSRLRWGVLAVAAVQFWLVLLLVVQSDMIRMDWSEPKAWELLWIPGLFGAPSGFALLLAVLGRGLGLAVLLCVATLLLLGFFMAIAQVATVAG